METYLKIKELLYGYHMCHQIEIIEQVVVDYFGKMLGQEVKIFKRIHEKSTTHTILKQTIRNILHGYAFAAENENIIRGSRLLYYKRIMNEVISCLKDDLDFRKLGE